MAYPGHQALSETISVPHGPDRYSALKHDFRLQRLSSSAPAHVGATDTSWSHLEGGGAPARPTWTGLTVGLMAALRSLMD